MISRPIAGFAAAGLLALPVACSAPTPPDESEKQAQAAPEAADLAEDSPAPTATPSAAASVVELDFAAQEDRADPERQLRY